MQERGSDGRNPQRIGDYEISVLGYRVERRFPAGDTGLLQTTGADILPGQTIAGAVIFPAYQSWRHMDKNQTVLTIEGNVNGDGEWKNGVIKFTLFP